jgi:predicted GNAT family N-acyltransferase
MWQAPGFMNMLKILRTCYSNSQDEIHPVRDEVFVREQGIFLDLEKDEQDGVCVHVLAMEGGQPVGTGRIDPGKDGKISRVAVLAPLRRYGIGRLMMDKLEKIASVEGFNRTWLHAQDGVPCGVSMKYWDIRSSGEHSRKRVSVMFG